MDDDEIKIVSARDDEPEDIDSVEGIETAGLWETLAGGDSDEEESMIEKMESGEREEPEIEVKPEPVIDDSVIGKLKASV